ncbi:MAG: response regulator transcription factor [Magnetococcales bacterium]|nr:response regulator transcription factor [Magnetococcales bacterium]
MIRILLADDHSIFREGLKKILSGYPDMVIAGEVENGDQVLAALQKEPWDILLLDVSMPGKSALELVSQIRRLLPALPVMILTMHCDQALATRFIRAGAKGYLTKDCGLAQLLHALRKVAAGHRYVDAALADLILDHMSNINGEAPSHTLLSDREFTVLCRIASGQTVTQIAEALSLSISAISSYRSRLLQKLGLENNAQLTNYALKNNLVK